MSIQTQESAFEGRGEGTRDHVLWVHDVQRVHVREGRARGHGAMRGVGSRFHQPLRGVEESIQELGAGQCVPEHVR